MSHRRKRCCYNSCCPPQNYNNCCRSNCLPPNACGYGNCGYGYGNNCSILGNNPLISLVLIYLLFR